MKNIKHYHKFIYIFGGVVLVALTTVIAFKALVPTNLQGYFSSPGNPSTQSISLSAQISHLDSEYAELDIGMIESGFHLDGTKNIGFMFNPKWGCHFNGPQNQSNSYTTYHWYERVVSGLGAPRAVLKFSSNSIIIEWDDNSNTVEGPSLIQVYIHPDTMNPVVNGQLEVCAALIDRDIGFPPKVDAWQSFSIPIGQLKILPPNISANPVQIGSVSVSWSSGGSAIPASMYSYKMNNGAWSLPVNFQSQTFGFAKLNSVLVNGDNTFLLKQKDVFGQWSEPASKTFKAYESYAVMPLQNNPKNVGVPTGKTSGQ